MGNIYVGQMKDTVKNYYKKAWEFKDKIDYAKKTYAEDVAQREIERIGKEQYNAYVNAHNLVLEIFDDAKTLLAKANVIDTESVPSEIKELFAKNSVYDLSANEVQAYVDQYKDNDTVMRIISDWIADKDEVVEGNEYSKYFGVRIYRPIDKVKTYKQFADSALNIIDKIHNDGTIMQRNIINDPSRNIVAGDPVEPVELNAYADESFARELYNIIGDGFALNRYKDKVVPEALLHTFDDIKVDMRFTMND